MPSSATITHHYYWKVTYSPKLRGVSIYDSERNFCLQGMPYLTGLFKIEDIETVFLKLKPETAFFCGHKLTINPDLSWTRRLYVLSEVLIAVEVARKHLKSVAWLLPNTTLRDYSSSPPETSLRGWKEDVRMS